jgi:hypothetical protein
LVQQEAKRAEDDLSSFRARALTIVTTSSGVVTLLTGLITLGASKVEEEKGLPDGVIVLLAFAFTAFVTAAGLALWANRGGEIDRPSGADLTALTEPSSWTEDAANPSEEERQVAVSLVKYVVTLRSLADRTASNLNVAIACQIAGITFAAAAGFVATVTIN